MKPFLTLLSVFSLFFCSIAQNNPLSITDVQLIWTPTAGGDNVIVSAEDADGDGPGEFVIQGPIVLDESAEYNLSIQLIDSVNGAFVNTALEADADSFQLFFGWDEDLFETPNGDGNIDDATSPVGYLDVDADSLPLGLMTEWISGCVDEVLSGDFRFVISSFSEKSDTSSVGGGQTLLDLVFEVQVADSPDAPPCENEEEIITDVTLTWTPIGGGEVVTVTAVDPDGFGPLDLEVSGPIELQRNTMYELSMTFLNSIEGEDITEEVREEGDEHQLFFEFTEGTFSDPTGTGNVADASGSINYLDMDEGGLPIGLLTEWMTEDSDGVPGSFRIILKHQPDEKSADSDVNTGGTDLDLTWDVNSLSGSSDAENPLSITDVQLIWTPLAGGDDVMASAKDADGDGPGGFVVEGPVMLDESAEYNLTIQLIDSVNGMVVSSGIAADSFQIFFGWDEDLFETPNGDGNIDSGADPVGYLDMDSQGLPLGLMTEWISGCVDEDLSGDFRLVLSHLMSKSDTSGLADGQSVLDITFEVQVADSPDAPPCENEEEIITDVTLTWTPVDGGEAVTVSATDPDGFGPLDLEVSGPIELERNKTYQLSLTLVNSIEGEDITEEIEEEADEHQFFFEFTEGIFSDPTGTGNVADASGAVNYLDMDENGLPVGLMTQWSTEDSDGMSGSFRLVLKHQPDEKSTDSDVNTGGTDLDLTWDVGNLVTDASDFNTDIDIVVFPNPTAHSLQIEGVKSPNSSVSLYDLYGNQVRVGQKLLNNSVNVSDLSSGAYIIVIEMGQEGKVRRRFIKK